MDQANFSELREKINNWDVQAEELLIQKIKFFSLKYNEDFQSLCKNFTNFSNYISSTEVEHLRAINQLKKISNERFIEQSLENYEQSQQENVINEEILLNPMEKMKKCMELSIQCIESVSRKHKNEVIEDDAASLASSKIVMEKNTKGLKIPHIIGTEIFNAEKAIGLDVAPEEEEEDDVENGVLKGIHVDPKQQAKWERVRKKKEEEERRRKMKNQRQQAQNNEEPEVKVPIENEGEQPKQENISNDNSSEIKIVSNLGGSVPPPPPPPPPPSFAPQAIQKKEDVVPHPQISIISQEQQPPENNQENPVKNENQIKIQPNQPQINPAANKPMDFQSQLRNIMQNRGNANINNNNNNQGNNMMNTIHTSADNKNPLAPVIRDENYAPNKNNVKLNNFIGGRSDDDDETDDIDIKNSLFRKNTGNNIPMFNHNNNIMNQPQIDKNENNNENPKPKEEPKIIEQKQEEVISPQKKILTESQFIQVKENTKLIKAGNKMKDLFGSDDEDEEENKPKNIVDKTNDLTAKLNSFYGGANINKKKEEPKKEESEVKPKKAFFEDIDEEKDNNKIEENNEKSSEVENKIENNENKINNLNNENNNNNQQPQKPKIAFFKDDVDEVKPNKEEKPKNEVKNPLSFMESLKGKLAQRNQALNKKEEVKKEEIKKEEPKKEESIKDEEPKKEEINKEESKKEEIKKEEPKKEEIKKEEPKKEEIKKEEPKKIEVKKEETKKEEPKKEEIKKEEPKKIEIKKEEPKKIEIKKEEPKKVEIKKEEPKNIEIKNEQPGINIKKTLTMAPKINGTSNLQNKFGNMKNMLAGRLSKGMKIGAPKPKQEQEKDKIEYNQPADKDKATYEEVIQTKSTKVVKKKKPKRTGTFNIGEERIPISKKPPKVEPIQEEKIEEEPKNEENKVEEPKEENKEEPRNEEQKEEPKSEEVKQEPKNEEIKEEPKSEEIKEENKNEEINKEIKKEEIKEEPKEENNQSSPPIPQIEENKSPNIKNSMFNLFFDDEKEKPKKKNLFDDIELDSNLPQSNGNNNGQQNKKINLDFLNDENEEVHKSNIVLDLDDNNPEPKINQNINNKVNGVKNVEKPKKKLAFFDDDD